VTDPKSAPDPRLVRLPVVDAFARFVRSTPGGIVAVVCADGKRRTVAEMTKGSGGT
jgi:hypothetical protein